MIKSDNYEPRTLLQKCHAHAHCGADGIMGEVQLQTKVLLSALLGSIAWLVDSVDHIGAVIENKLGIA